MKPEISIERIVVGELSANCYAVYAEGGGDAVLIDPGGDAEKILGLISRKKLRVKHIVITHGHIDHTSAAAMVKESLKPAPALCIHREDSCMLKNAELSLACAVAAEFRAVEPETLLGHGDSIHAGGVRLRVLHTPGHTPGGICLAGDGFVFTGDTLFASGIGRTDFPGGDLPQLVKSISEILFGLEDETAIYPGHGPESSIGREKPLLREWT